MTHWADDESLLAPVPWTRPHASTFPVTGAWRPGDPLGQRQFMRMAVDRPFVLEGGGQLRDITIAFETWGTLDADAGNAVLVCHALTGDAHAAGPAGPGHPTLGWWDDVIGPGKALDTDRYFVVCANVLGGCQGTSGPASPRGDQPGHYGPDFPVVSIRDMVRTQAKLADALGIERWLAVVGGSMGGMQVLEWGVMYPERARGLVPIATSLAATAQQIAWWS
ncbi:MAG: metX, partial [Acidimicrobiales bacterium]|nr:metX [Acidimicrobiales bacterium]